MTPQSIYDNVQALAKNLVASAHAENATRKQAVSKAVAEKTGDAVSMLVAAIAAERARAGIR